MGNKKSTVKAAKAQIEKDTKDSQKTPTPKVTQGSLVDRHVRNHTPDSLYGEDSES
ncbi:hypothetical protein [Streptomyces europaeiscabiei]|uniref:hypothetical protein n=1 Tax=Streptomyces europaeiscabiei TaxID=146819 RepID=UPI0029AE1C72|nr:hypothetical protein [Streptomyces europaeiscabiei]MDX3841716.1 hypothetical protein [Streptomyces europaeiscabiei]